jgi:hypothetical protein
MFTYWGFGLKISSEIEFPEFSPADFLEPDLTISIGKTPSELLGENVSKRAFSSISKDEYLLNVANICRYYVGYGKQIIAEPMPSIDEKSVRLFLLGTVMAAALYQRGSIPIHASAILKDGKLILFAGNSGAGKSTLLAHMAANGYSIFSDDICVMQHKITGKDGVYCTASYPMIKLWDDTITALDNNIFTRDYKVRPQLPKYGQFFHNQFNSSQIPLEKIFILKADNHAKEIKIERLALTDAFKKLETQAYKNQLIADNQLRRLHFTLLAEVTNYYPIFEVVRPFNIPATTQVYDIIAPFL